MYTTERSLICLQAAADLSPAHALPKLQRKAAREAAREPTKAQPLWRRVCGCCGGGDGMG